MSAKASRFVLALLLGLSVVACSPKIYGTVKLFDRDLKPVQSETPVGTTVNIINTTAKVEQASTSVPVNEKGEFESAKDSLEPGTYKIEASRIGYLTETRTVEIGSSTRKKLAFELKKIDERDRGSIGGASSDAEQKSSTLVKLIFNRRTCKHAVKSSRRILSWPGHFS